MLGLREEMRTANLRRGEYFHKVLNSRYSRNTEENKTKTQARIHGGVIGTKTSHSEKGGSRISCDQFSGEKELFSVVYMNRNAV